ncbi:hypothetical protein RJ639_046282 [Escallonia herrerae]|uniref:Uncharacterized protein n=1 Tax=Escallonia herrerae TaxID=1293975 RepID=A0AA88WFK8_9ASTE|nr:hypothetical protein RJ639_046282 [Escallonia herrerae]
MYAYGSYCTVAIRAALVWKSSHMVDGSTHRRRATGDGRPATGDRDRDTDTAGAPRVDSFWQSSAQIWNEQDNEGRTSPAKFLLGLIPLLTSSGDGQGGSSFATGQSDDELSTNYGGLDLEALSRLDGRRWSSSCRSQEGLELVAVNRDGEEESMTESIRTLSQKYRPMFFEELIGQNIVVQSLMNAILRGRVASLYLFQGPCGTGKTSTARVLAAALNCLASNKTKPCGPPGLITLSIDSIHSLTYGEKSNTV